MVDFNATDNHNGLIVRNIRHICSPRCLHEVQAQPQTITECMDVSVCLFSVERVRMSISLIYLDFQKSFLSEKYGQDLICMHLDQRVKVV